MSGFQFASEMMSHAVEAYLVSRYPGLDLDDLTQAELIQQHDGQLARMLRQWREAAQWKQPSTIGESRCVDCTKVMGDESSACEDETVCHDCAANAGPSSDLTEERT